MEKAARRAVDAHRTTEGRTKSKTQKSIILGALKDAIKKVSGDGQHRYSHRQLFYAIRPLLIKEFGKEPNYGTFTDVIKDHEESAGRDLPGIYRDSRGVLYHPHTHEEIQLGTLTVEKYERPEWTFNKILYSEKEGLFPILKHANWPEEYDCALLTSKGYATRAVCDVLNVIGETSEPILVFCIHDADGPGTVIFESMEQAVKARPGASAKVRIINLGLEPEDAVKMGLEAEKVERKKDKKTGQKRAIPVAGYLSDDWRAWLQSHRVELNAMTTPEFLKWLNRKIAPYHRKKLVAPNSVLEEKFRTTLREHLRKQIIHEVLREAGVDERVARALEAWEPKVAQRLKDINVDVRNELDVYPAKHWSDPVKEFAAELVDSETQPEDEPSP
jgi:hypothetical protein